MKRSELLAELDRVKAEDVMATVSAFFDGDPPRIEVAQVIVYARTLATGYDAAVEAAIPEPEPEVPPPAPAVEAAESEIIETKAQEVSP